MRLLNASRYFDDVVIRDAYTNLYLFKGQVAAYIDTQVDGTISRRRVISLAVNLTLPQRRALTYGGENWIVGDGVKDYLQGVALRTSYAAKKCNGLFDIRTPGQAALNTPGVAAYCQSDYLKSTVNSPTDAEYDGQYEIFYSVSESVAKGTIFLNDGKLYHVRGTHSLLEGFMSAEADELDTGVVAITFTDTGAYQPATDTYAGTSIATTGLLLDMYKLYRYKTSADPLNHAGDMSLIVAASAVTPVQGMTVTSPSEVYRVEQVLPYQDAWLCHLRRV